MPDQAAIRLSIDGPVGRIVLNRPEARNAINWAMVEAIPSALSDFACDSRVRVIELTAEGPAFCAGGDLSLLEQLSGGDDHMAAEFVGRYRALPSSLYDCPLPIVAGVAGPAVGAGCDLVLACDLVIATPRASFAEMFVDVGLAPDTGGSGLLPRHVGLMRAKALILTGQPIAAQVAHDWGLVHEVVSDLPKRLEHWTGMLASKSPAALRHAKRLLHRSWGLSHADVLEEEGQAVLELLRSEELISKLRPWRDVAGRTAGQGKRR